PVVELFRVADDPLVQPAPPLDLEFAAQGLRIRIARFPERADERLALVVLLDRQKRFAFVFGDQKIDVFEELAKRQGEVGVGVVLGERHDRSQEETTEEGEAAETAAKAKPARTHG